jgi:membrane-associated phospholipid phosphatase
MTEGPARFAAYKWAWGLAVTAVQSWIYFGVGHAHVARSTEILRTALDDAIPFLPFTVWFYAPVYPAILVAALVGFRSRVTFHRALVGMGIVMVVALAGHVLVKAEYPRPLLHPPFHNLSEAFLAAVQSTDPPANVFPSLHVAHSSSLALLVHRDNPRLGGPLIVLAALLALSTLTTKQHFIVDVIAGLALAAGVRTWVLRRSP